MKLPYKEESRKQIHFEQTETEMIFRVDGDGIINTLSSS